MAQKTEINDVTTNGNSMRIPSMNQEQKAKPF